MATDNTDEINISEGIQIVESEADENTSFENTNALLGNNENLVSGENEEDAEIPLQSTKNALITSSYSELTQTDISELQKNLNIGGDLINDIDQFLNNGSIDFKKQGNLKSINILNNIIKYDSERHKKLEDIVNEKTISMSHTVNKKIAKNNGKVDYYTTEQKMLIQLWANVCYGENLVIDGFKKRGKKNIIKVDDSNEGKTNLYIYQLELKTRGDVMDFRDEFDSLLDIPNLDAKFDGISQDAKNSIMREFLQFFLKIKWAGMGFEDKIGAENIEKVLTYLINAEKYREISVQDYFESYLDEQPDDNEKTELASMKEKLKSYRTMGEFFKECAQKLMNILLENKDKLAAYNGNIALQQKIQEFNTLFNDKEIGEEEKKEKLEKLGKEILDNPLLDPGQRNDILLLLGIKFRDNVNFKEITGAEIRKEIFNKITNNDNNIFFTSQLNSHWGDSPHTNIPSRILYNEGCDVTFNYSVYKRKYQDYEGLGSDGEYEGGLTFDVCKVDILVDGSVIKFNANNVPYLEGYDIELNANNELIIKKGGIGSELQSKFGDKAYDEYQESKIELTEKHRENEEINDIIAQVDSDEKMELLPISVESKKIIDDETGYTQAYNKYKDEHDSYISKTTNRFRGDAYQEVYRKTEHHEPTEPQKPFYNEYRELKIPGCGQILVHFERNQLDRISEIIQKNGKNVFVLPKKKTGKIFELSPNDIKIYEKDNKGNIHLFNRTPNFEKGDEYYVIDGNEVKKAKDLNDLIFATISELPGLHEAVQNASSINDNIAEIQELYKKFDKGNLSDNDANRIRDIADNLSNYLQSLCKHHNDFVQLKKYLLDRSSGESVVETEYERALKTRIASMDYMINATVDGGEIQQICSSMLNVKDLHSNDELYKRIGRWFQNNLLETIGAIVGGILAVLLAPESGGSSIVAFIEAAALMGAGGIVGGFTGHVFNEFVNDQYYDLIGGIEVTDANGNKRKVDVSYNDPTSLELALEGEISLGEFTSELLIQYIETVATTFGCMYAGKLIGGWITKACQSGKITPKFKTFLERCNRNFKVENGDPTTDTIFKQMSEKIGACPNSTIKNFNEKFFNEFVDELKDEVFETGFDEASNAAKSPNGGNTYLSIILSGCAMLATAWHSITPGGNMSNMYKNNGISIGDLNYNESSNALEITLDYSGDYETIMKYYEKNHFKPVDGHLEMPNPDNPAITNIIYLRKTEISMEKRALAGRLVSYGITLDPETGEGYYKSIKKIHELELSGVANVSINPDTKEVTIISGETTLQLKKMNINLTQNQLLEYKRIEKIFKEFDIDFSRCAEIYNEIPLSGKDEKYIHDALSLLNKHNNYTKGMESDIVRNIKSLEFILSNSKLTTENIDNILQNENININDIEYAIKENNNISDENSAVQEIKKFNILLNIESEEDLQGYMTGKKRGSDISGNIEQFITDNGLSKHAEQIKNWYYGNYNHTTQKHTIVRDLQGSEYDINLIKSIINHQNMKPRLLENQSTYEGLKKLHDKGGNYELFYMYSKYLLGEDVSGLAGKYSEGSGGGFSNDAALYWHTRTGDGYKRNGSNSKYRIIGEFSQGDIIRSGNAEQLGERSANWDESERITLGEVPNHNISQIIDLTTGKIIYDRDSGYIDPAFVDGKSNHSSNTELGTHENHENTGNKKKKNRDSNYFNGQSHEYNIENMQEVAIENSQYMDNLLESIDESNEKQKLNELREKITALYAEVTGEILELSDDQLLSILDAHEQDGKLGELTKGQLKKKVQVLQVSITDPKVRRFLLEFGYCGSLFSGLFNKAHSLISKIFKGHKEKPVLVHQIGELVNVPGYKGGVRGYIQDFNQSSGEYFLAWNESGIQHIKAFTIEELNSVNSKTYKIGDEVNVPGSDGFLTKARISSYNPDTGEYTVNWIENGQLIHREVSQLGLDELNSPLLEAIPLRNSQAINIDSINDSQLNTFRQLKKGPNERIYLQKFGEPKRVLNLGNGEKLYVSNCFDNGNYSFIIGYTEIGGELRLRLFYRSQSEGSRRSCPGQREIGGGYSKGEMIPNYSYETTTKVVREIQNIFDTLPLERISPLVDPICSVEGVGYNILEPEMIERINVDKLFSDYPLHNTTDYMRNKRTIDVVNMYNNLGKGIDLSGMNVIEGKGYTYVHQYLGTVDVKVCEIKISGKKLNVSFAKVQNDAANRVRIEEINYADAKITSFGIYDKQINATPLAGKPIEYLSQVPRDRNGDIYGGKYIDIRDLYQGNPIIQRFKEISSN